MVLRLASVYAVALASMLGPAETVLAAPVPDDARLPSLQAACDSVGHLRVTTTRREFEASRLELTADAVLIPPLPGRPALITVGDPRDPSRRIPWADVERIDSSRSHTVRSTLIGALVGGVIGGALVAQGPDIFEKGDNARVGLAVLLTAATAGVGMLHGMTHPEMHPIYP